MRMFDDISRFAAAYLAHRTRRRTERLLGALPNDVRKDIGWPDSVQGRIRIKPGLQS